MHRVIALLFASLGLLRGAVLAAEKPNVLFIAVDDLKPVLGCYGDNLVKSPNIDRLAARGVVFDRAYYNQAVCAPSRNALLTGRRPTTLGIYDLGTNFRKAAPDAVTLPQHFMAHGYRAEGLGKIFHTGHGNVDDAASWSVPLFREKTVTYLLPENLKMMTREEALFANQAVTKDMVRGVPTEAADVPDEGYPDGRIAAEAVRRLHAAAEKPGVPFFIAVGFFETAPALLRAILSTKYPEAKPPLPADRAAMFEQRDQNHDGQLTREEFLADQPDPDQASARFRQLDTDKNSTLSRDEFIYSGKLPPSKTK